METSKYKSFVFRESWWDIIKNLPATQKSIIMESLCKYVFDDEEQEVDILSPAGMAIQFIKRDMDLDKKKYERIKERRREAGKKGNEVRWNTSEKVSQNIANIANATKNEEKSDTNDSATESKNENENDKKGDEKVSQTVANIANATTEQKEKEVLLYSLHLLSQGRPNSYSEAERIYEYYDSMNWAVEVVKSNGDKVVKKYANHLAFLKAGTPKNGQLFSPTDGQLMATIMGKIGCSSANKDIIDNFRGFQMEGDTTISIIFSTKKTSTKFQKAFDTNRHLNQIVSTELVKIYPKVDTIMYSIYKQ